jgi:sortase A
MFHAAMAKFEAQKHASANAMAVSDDSGEPADSNSEPRQVQSTELWSVQRVTAHTASLDRPFETLGVLRILKINLEVPVLNGTDEFTLNRGVGRIRGTSFPGEAGNIGIAGHRDGFFRGLKDVSPGDAIELVTPLKTDVYVVERIRITNPSDVSGLQPRAKTSLTLVTCYPFYFVGPAPRRYVVEASLRQ